MEIEGKIKRIFDTQQVTDSFRKREFVVEYAENPSYPEFLKFELIQDNTSILDDVQPGDQVKVFFNLKGREWTNPKGEVVYFNSLQAWRIVSGEVSNVQTGQADISLDADAGDETDDLPF